MQMEHFETAQFEQRATNLSDMELIANLDESNCLGCGRRKKPNMAVCDPCFWKLSKHQQCALQAEPGTVYIRAIRSALYTIKHK